MKTLLFPDHYLLFIRLDIQIFKWLYEHFQCRYLKYLFIKMLIISTLFALFTFFSFVFLLMKKINKSGTDKYLIFKTKLLNFRITCVKVRWLFVLHYPEIIIPTEMGRPLSLYWYVRLNIFKTNSTVNVFFIRCQNVNLEKESFFVLSQLFSELGNKIFTKMWINIFCT